MTTDAAAWREKAREVCKGMGPDDAIYFDVGVKRVADALAAAEQKGFEKGRAHVEAIIREAERRTFDRG